MLLKKSKSIKYKKSLLLQALSTIAQQLFINKKQINLPKITRYTLNFKLKSTNLILFLYVVLIYI